MLSTRCCSPNRRWQTSMTSWRQKEAYWTSPHHTPPIREDYWRPQSNQWNTTYGEHCVLVLYLWKTMRNVVGDRGLSKFKTLISLSDETSNPTLLSLGHFLIGKPLIQLLAIDLTNVETNRLSMWQTYKNRYCSSDSDGQMINSRACSSVIDGWGQHTNYCQVTSSWWMKTSRHPCGGQRLSSRTLAPVKMASFV